MTESVTQDKREAAEEVNLYPGSASLRNETGFVRAGSAARNVSRTVRAAAARASADRTPQSCLGTSVRGLLRLRGSGRPTSRPWPLVAGLLPWRWCLLAGYHLVERKAGAGRDGGGSVSPCPRFPSSPGPGGIRGLPLPWPWARLSLDHQELLSKSNKRRVDAEKMFVGIETLSLSLLPALSSPPSSFLSSLLPPLSSHPSSLLSSLLPPLSSLLSPPFSSRFAKILLWPQITRVKFKGKENFWRNIGCEIGLINERKLPP